MLHSDEPIPENHFGLTIKRKKESQAFMVKSVDFLVTNWKYMEKKKYIRHFESFLKLK